MSLGAFREPSFDFPPLLLVPLTCETVHLFDLILLAIETFVVCRRTKI